MERALIVVAHPDDEVLGAGGLMSRFENLWELRVLCLAEGSSARYSDRELHTKDILRDIDERKKSARKANSMFRTQGVFFNDFLYVVA